MIMRFSSLACLLFVLSCPLRATDLDDIYRSAFSGELGYTLIGEKAISQEDFCYLNTCADQNRLDFFVASLKKDFSESKKFVLKVFPLPEGYQIELIHRKCLRRIVAQSHFLKRIIGKLGVTEVAFLARIEDTATSIFSNYADTRGILFGYGRNNTLYFCRECDLAAYLHKFPTTYCLPWEINPVSCTHPSNFPDTIELPYQVRKPQSGVGFDSLESEWRWLQNISWDLQKNRATVPPWFIDFPQYRNWRTPESMRLLVKYDHAKNKLAKIFYKKSPRQAVLDEIHKEEPAPILMVHNCMRSFDN